MRDDVALINPPQQMVACQQMLQAVTNRIAAVEGRLTRTVLDREAYLQQIGGALALRELRDEIESVYARHFDR